MRLGRRWLAFDADFYGNDFTDRLHARFGWAGVGVFVAFLCAAKRSPVPGRISFSSDTEALELLRIRGWDLIDDHGQPWTLDDFWTFTGRMKQTRKTCRGRIKNVSATRWERWQDTQKTCEKPEQTRRSEARKTRQDSDSDKDSDSDTPARTRVTSRRRPPEDFKIASGKPNGHTNGDPVVAADAVKNLLASNLRIKP